jgi:hypothetical protein
LCAAAFRRVVLAGNKIKMNILAYSLRNFPGANETQACRLLVLERDCRALRIRRPHLVTSCLASSPSFAAVNAPSADAKRQLHALLAPGESTWLSDGQYPQVPQLTCEETLLCFQMVLPADLSAPSPTIGIVPLSTASAQKMVDLTTLAFPGSFRSRTCEMGSHYGVRSPSGELIAMGGERLQLDGYSEISAVCTHPSFRRQGFAARLIWHSVRNHRCDGLVSWLHVGCAHRAVKFYLGMGFQQVRKVTLHCISRKTL